jgi:hypothetical protein
MYALILLIVIFAILIGGVFLQFFLSKRESRLLGLILPFITFCVSLLYIVDLIVNGYNAAFIAPVPVVFFVCNIPTGVLLAIYFACREKIKKQLALEKMSVQDL